MSTADVVAHTLVAVTIVLAVMVLGLAGVLSGDAIVAVLVTGGGAVSVLTISDRLAYGRRGKP